jgi:RNA polymerase sigma factor (sigma-70 family)
MPDPHSEDFHGANFRTTHWSVVLEAGDLEAGKGALEKLCRAYWYPLYAYVRRRGYSESEAQDLTQDFFLSLLEGGSLQTAHPSKGRFRGFLAAALRNFLANEWRDAHRLKRGGAAQFLSWEGLDAEERFSMEPPSDTSPEATFDREWAQTVAANALDQLRREMEREGNTARFQTLRAYLETDASTGSYSDAASLLGLSESAVKSAIHRARRRYAEIIREEIAQTVCTEEEVRDEIRTLIELLAG